MSRAGAKVTVVIPVWDDYVTYLADAVESALRSSPRPAVVVVDNASTTAVPDLEGCTVVRAPRRLSEGAARNLGLQSVTTEYVLFLDADDMLLEGALELMESRIAAEPELAVSACSILDAATGERHRTPRPFVARLARRPRLFALANSVWSLLPIQGCAVLRTAQVREAGGYADADLGEDWDLGVSLAWRGRVEVSDRLGRYYRSEGGSDARRVRSPGELRAIARRIRRRIREDPGMPAAARALLPLIAVLQIGAIHLARPLYLALRELLARGRRTSVESGSPC